MNETERIRNMVEAGTITEAEAERLLGVLRDIDRAGEELTASGAAMEAEADRAESLIDARERQETPARGPDEVASRPAEAAGDGAAAPTGASAGPRGRAAVPADAGASAAAAEPGPAADEAAPGTSCAPAGTRWVHVSLLAGDLSLRADPEADRVQVKGDGEGIEVEPTADGFEVRHVGRKGMDSWVDRFLSRIRSGHVEVRIPGGHGVDLGVTAGDVELRDVPYLRGRLTSGNLDARGLRGIDFVTAAGDLDLEMTLTEGRHRLRATAGDVTLRLGAGSSVAVDGSVSIGSASVQAPGFDVDRRGIGQHFRGELGGAAAELDVHVTTGDLKVRASDEHE